MPTLTTPNGKPASSLCFGCMQFGGTASRQDSHAMYTASRATGINFFDTAYVYTEGASETYLGSFAKHEREDLIVASKCAYTGGSGRENILDMFETSRQRLNMDMIDILYLHRWDENTPLEDSFETLTELQSSGKIRFIGVSNFAAWQVVKAQHVAQSFGTRIDIIQPMYSLVKRQAEVELLPMAHSENIAVAPYSPLGGGLLTGKYQNGATGRLTQDDRYAARYNQDWMRNTANALNARAAQSGVHPATLAVAWAARHAAVTAPIISARNAAQLEPSLAAAQHRLSEEDYAAITALSVTPAPATDRLEEAD